MAKQGAPLKHLTTPPPRSVGGFGADVLTSGGRYAVTVEPYGLGPDVGQNRTLVVLIAAARGLNGATGAEKLVGINAVVYIPTAEPGYASGGKYSAVLTLMPNSRGAIMELSSPLK